MSKGIYLWKVIYKIKHDKIDNKILVNYCTALIQSDEYKEKMAKRADNIRCIQLLDWVMKIEIINSQTDSVLNDRMMLIVICYKVAY